jgi:hypothetical protein
MRRTVQSELEEHHEIKVLFEKSVAASVSRLLSQGVTEEEALELENRLREDRRDG